MRFSRLFTIFIILTLALTTEFLWEFPNHAAATEVSGDVWGIWYAGNSPYYLTDNVTIPYGKTLSIEPGVWVIANDSYYILVAGTLYANGTALNDIVFHVNNSKPTEYKWEGIIFNETGTGVLQNCTIKQAVIGIHMNNSKDVRIINSYVFNNNYGFYISNNSINNSIINCDIKYNTYNGYLINSSNNNIIETNIRDSYWTGLVLIDSDSNYISSSSIYDNFNIGIQFLGNSTNNTIYNSNIGPNGYGKSNYGLIIKDNSTNNSVLYSDFTNNWLKVDNVRNSNILISGCWFSKEVIITNSDNVTITGCTLYYDESSIILDSAEAIEISNCTINTYYDGIIVNEDSKNVKIKYCFLSSSERIGIAVHGALNIVISNCSIQSSPIGIFLNSSINIIIQNSWIYNNEYGISLYNSQNTQITNCEVNYSGYQGINIYQTTKTDIESCRIVFNNNNGLFLDKFSNETRVADTIISYNENYGLMTSGSSYDISFFNCTFNKNYIGTAFYSPIKGLDIRKCKINYNSEHGIYTNINKFSIYDSVINNNYANGIFSNLGELLIQNCSLRDNSRALFLNAYYFNNNVTAYLINTNYNSDIKILDERSIAYTGWNLDIAVETTSGTPVPDAIVSIIPTNEDIYQTTKNFVTDSAGKVRDIICYQSTQTSQRLVNYNPYTISAKKTGVGVGSNELSIFAISDTTVVLKNYDVKVSSVTVSWPNGKVPVDELFNITAEIENLADIEFTNIGLQIRITGDELNRTFTIVVPTLSESGKVESTLEAQTIDQQGLYTATAEIDIDNDIFEIDEENNIFSTQFSVHPRPVAVLVANNTNPYVGDNITFYANESYSPVAILEYIFDFNDGTIIRERINNIIRHKFDKKGNYEVSLTVIDVDGIPSFKTFVSIVVKPRPKPIIPPVAKFIINPPTGDVTTDFLCESSGSTSAPGTNLVEFDWSFGDNTTSNFESPIHRYFDDGSYIITLKVTDSLGKISEIYQQALIVFNTGPSIVLSVDKNKVLVGEQVTFNASNTYDSDDTLAEPLTRFIWNFGDNSSYSESPIQYPDGEYDKIATHIYTKPGDYTITVVVIDDDGESNQTSVNITVLAVDKDDQSDDSDALVFNQGIIISAIILFCILILIVFLVFYNRRRRRYTRSGHEAEPGYGSGALDYPYYDEYGKGESGYGPGKDYGASVAGVGEAGKKKEPRKGGTKGKGKGKSKRTSRKSLADSIKPVVVDVELPEEKVVDWKDEESAYNHTLSMTDVHVLTNGDLSEASIIGLEDEQDEFEEVFEPEPEEESDIEFEPEFEEEPEETEDVLFEEVFEEEPEDIAEDELEKLTETELESEEFESEEYEDTDTETLVFEFEDEGESVTTELHPTQEDIPAEKKTSHKKGERLIPIPGVGFVTKEELKSAIGEKPDDEYSAEDYYRRGLGPDEMPPAEYGAGTEPSSVPRAQAELDMRCKTCYREIPGKFIKIRRKGLDSDGKQFVPIGPFCSPECAAKFEKQW